MFRKHCSLEVNRRQRIQLEGGDKKQHHCQCQRTLYPLIRSKCLNKNSLEQIYQIHLSLLPSK